MGYRQEVVKGVGWIGGLRAATRVVSFLRTVVVARILTPSQFGIFTLAAIVLSFSEILTETGINIFLIQKKESVGKYIDTAWTVSILRGFILFALINGAALPLAYFYNPDLLDLLRVISLVPLIRGFINPSIVRFMKELKFSMEFFYRFAIFSAESAATLAAVYVLRSPVGLAVGLIAGAVFEVLISFMLVSPKPAFRFNFSLFKEIIGRSKWLTATGILSYSYQNADDLIIGRVLGSTQLGFYDMAYRISTLPISEVADVVWKTTFPVFVKMREDKEILKNRFFQSMGIVMALVVPMGIVFFVFPEIIIKILLGEKWIDAAGVLRVLAAFGVLRAVSICVLSPIYALEKQEHITVINFLSLSTMLVSIIPLISFFGIEGAALSVVLGSVVPLPFIFYSLRKVFNE